MKNAILYLSTFVLLLSIGFSSCSKDDEVSQGYKETPEGPLRALINDDSKISTTDAHIEAYLFNDKLIIKAISIDSSKKLIITVFEPTVGTFDIEDDECQANIDMSNAFGSVGFFECNTGKVRIDAIDFTAKTISGVFDFQGTIIDENLSVIIKQGVMDNMTYTDLRDYSQGHKELSASVSGSNFNASNIDVYGTSIVAADSLSNIIIINTTAYSTGSYDLVYGTEHNAEFRKTGLTSYYVLNTGTLNITKYSNFSGEYEGSFSFTAVNPNDSTDTYSISNGSFYMIR